MGFHGLLLYLVVSKYKEGVVKRACTELINISLGLQARNKYQFERSGSAFPWDGGSNSGVEYKIKIWYSENIFH